MGLEWDGNVTQLFKSDVCCGVCGEVTGSVNEYGCCGRCWNGLSMLVSAYRTVILGILRSKGVEI